GPGVGLQGGLEARIIGCRTTRTLGHAESGEDGVAEARVGAEERRIRDVGTGVATLDVVEPQLVERPGDQALVLEREVDTRRLRTVAQRRIEEIEPLAGHAATGHATIRSTGLEWRCRQKGRRPLGSGRLFIGASSPPPPPDRARGGRRTRPSPALAPA